MIVWVGCHPVTEWLMMVFGREEFANILWCPLEWRRGILSHRSRFTRPGSLTPRRRRIIIISLRRRH